MNNYMLKIETEPGVFRSYQDELRKLGATEEYINSDEFEDNCRNIALACSAFKERLNGLYSYYGKEPNEEETIDFLDNVLDYCIENYGDLKLSKKYAWRNDAARLQRRRLSNADKKDSELKFELEKIGLVVGTAAALAKVESSRDITAFRNFHNYDIPELEDKDEHFEYYKQQDYLFIEFPDED